MLEWGDEEQEDDFRDELERYESQLSSGSIGFFDSDSLEAIVDHYLISGFYSKAEHVASIGMEQYPFHTLFFVRRAQSLSGLGRLKDALNQLDDIENRVVNQTELFATKAAIFSQLKDSKRSILFYRKALEQADNEEKDDLFLDLATELEQLNDYRAAIKVLQEAMHLNPNNEGALYELAYCYDQIDDNEQAIRAYQLFLDENPYSYTAWYNLGNTFSKVQNFEMAIESYEFCVTINDKFSPAYFNLGNAYLSNEQFQHAVKSFLRCIELDGEDAHTYCYLAESYENLEDLPAAWDYYQKALTLIPELAEAWIGLGIVKDLEGEPKLGLRYIQRALELEPDNPSYHHVFAGALENAEMYEEAGIAYLDCLELDPANEDCFFDYVDYLIEYKTGEARTFVEKYSLEHHYFFSILPLIYISWIQNEKQTAKIMLIECFNKEPEKTKDLFVRYPDLAEVEELVNLTK